MHKDWTGVRLRSRIKARHLASLVAIAEAGSLRQAAAKLAVTQPSLSKLLRELEVCVGRTLFVRSRRGLAPTPHGSAVIDHAKRMLRDLDALADHLVALDHGTGGRIRLGVIPYVSSDWLRDVISWLQAQPPIELQITEAATDVLLEGLRDRRLDCVVGRITSANSGADLAWRPVIDQSLRIVARAGHPLARRGRKVQLSHLAGEDWLLPPAGTPTRHLINQLFNEAGLAAPTSALETYSLPILESVLADRDVLAAVPDDIAQQFERRGTIRALAFRWPLPPICLVWRAGDEDRPIIRRFEQAALAARHLRP